MIKNHIKDKIDKIVLVGVLRNKRDLNILLTESWYRIPMRHAPKRKFDYLAFYQPTSFGRKGKRIQYYAPVLDYKVIKRSDLLPKELNHPRAKNYYLQIHVGKIEKLSQPVRNIIPRRISFGFTTLNHLLKSKNILQLYNIAPTEQIMEDGLRLAGIKAIAQYYVLSGPEGEQVPYGASKKRYCLDFAVFCKRGSIAIECDNKKAHSSLRQREKDKIKNISLRRHGWKVIRLPEHDIVSDLRGCIVRIKKAIRKFGGLRLACRRHSLWRRTAEGFTSSSRRRTSSRRSSGEARLRSHELRRSEGGLIKAGECPKND